MNTEFQKAVLDALEMDLKGRIARHTVNVQNYLVNGVGVPEHPDIVESIESELGKVAEATDKLEALQQVMKSL